MKSKFFPLLAVLAVSLTVASCNKEDEFVGNGPQFNVSTEAPVSDDSKTLFSGVNANGYWEFYWKNTDKVALYDASFNRAIYTDHGATGLNRIFADFQCDSGSVSGDHFKAFYPSFYVGVQSSDFVYKLPATQQLDNDGVDHTTADVTLTRFPMAGVNDGNEIHLKNLCGILRIQLQATGKAVRSITFESLEDDKQLHGTFIVTFDDNGIPSLTKTQAGQIETKSVKLSFQVPVSIDEAQSFFIALPPDRYTGYRIKVEEANGEVFSVKSNSVCNIIRSQMTTYKRGETINNKTITFKPKGGRFTIERNGTTPTRKVYISPGNLQYKNTNWQFADQQYQIIHDATYNPSVTYQYDLFGISVNPSSRYNYGMAEPYPMNWGGSREFLDWGHVFDGIDASGNNVQSPWFTLTKPQWNCMLHERNTDITIGGVSNARYAPIIIDGRYPGYIIFPDSWVGNYTFTGTWPSASTVNNAPYNTEWHLNAANMTLSWENWLSLESAGCAFLPMTGKASANSTSVEGYVSDFTNLGFYYWTASRPDHALNNETFHWCQGVPLFVQNHDFYFMDSQNADNRCAVRLVREAPLN